MTIAELHGKLSSDNPAAINDRLEDMLTSDVFGTMKYAGWDMGFMKWLRTATEPDGTSNASAVLPRDQDIRRVHIIFWPTLTNGREPDVLLGIETKDKCVTAVMVEAKYHSGASDFEVDDTKRTAELSGNQIADQVNGFPPRIPGSVRRRIASRIHLYVTAHYDCPTYVYEQAVSHINNKNVLLYWLNWQTLCDHLHPSIIEDEGKRLMVGDLLRLLDRKRLVPFRGFHPAHVPDLSGWPSPGFWTRKVRSWWSASPPVLPSTHSFWRNHE